MYERILIPLDGSKTGEAALNHVKKLISRLSPQVKTKIILMQVIPPCFESLIAGEAVAMVPCSEEELKQAKQRAVNYLSKAGEALEKTGATVTFEARIGNAYEEIIKAADEIKADLIAMSTHGRSGLSRWAFGSITDKVLRHGGDIPILAVRPSKD